MRQIIQDQTIPYNFDINSLNLPENVGAVYGDYIQNYENEKFQVKELLGAVTYSDVLNGCKLPPMITIIRNNIKISNTTNMAILFLEIMSQGYAVWHIPQILSITKKVQNNELTKSAREYYGAIYL